MMNQQPAEAQSKAVNDITAIAEKFRVALVDGDTVTLRKLTSPVLSYGHSGGSIQDQEAFLAAFGSGKSDFVTIDVTDQTIALSGDVAIVRHNLAATTNDSGKPGAVKLGVLLIWQKEKSKWHLIARQAVKQAH